MRKAGAKHWKALSIRARCTRVLCICARCNGVSRQHSPLIHLNALPAERFAFACIAAVDVCAAPPKTIRRAAPDTQHHSLFLSSVFTRKRFRKVDKAPIVERKSMRWGALI